MPNYCVNYEVITGPKPQVRTLHGLMLSWLEQTAEQPGFWIAKILRGAGIKDDDLDERGEITDQPEYLLVNNKPCILFSSVTAWENIPDTWREILRKFAPDCEYYYSSYEPGVGFYEKHDPTGQFFPETYHLDCDITNEETCSELGGIESGDYTDDGISAILHDLGYIGSLEDMVRDFNEKYRLDPDNLIAINKYQEV